MRTPVVADIAVMAKLFRGFSDPTRLGILVQLLEGERRVTDLVEAVGTSQGNVSAHLSCLKDCGLVLDRPEKRQVFYRIASPAVVDVLRSAEALLAIHGHDIDLCRNYNAPEKV
ncbi:MAG: ArsR/SmtB family transcription factor [Actinomycetota bacterium]